MKLRPYTPVETDELLNKFKIISDYCYSINKSAYTLVLHKYAQYLENFKMGWFTWSPLDFEKFCKQLSWTGVRFTEYNGYYPNQFEKDFFYKPLKLLRHTHYTQIYDYHFTRYGVPAFTENEHNIFEGAGEIVTEFVFDYELHTKYITLIKYASQPFEFDESDIKWLEKIERLYNKAIKWNSN